MRSGKEEKLWDQINVLTDELNNKKDEIKQLKSKFVKYEGVVKAAIKAHKKHDSMVILEGINAALTDILYND